MRAIVATQTQVGQEIAFLGEPEKVTIERALQDDFVTQCIEGSVDHRRIQMGSLFSAHMKTTIVLKKEPARRLAR